MLQVENIKYKISRCFLARDAFVRTNRRAMAMIFIRLSVCPSRTGVHCQCCDHTVHVSAVYDWIVHVLGTLIG